MDVMIVDDEPAARNTLRKMLSRAGFMVTTADNGLAALAELREQQVHAILCDIQMPFLEGRRFYDELVNELPEMAKRLVFVTGWADDSQIREIVERTGRPVIRKPVDATELEHVVRSIVERDDN